MRLALLVMLVSVIWCRYIESRISNEESSGLQREAKHIHRHNRPILWPHDMVGSEGVPHDEIGSHERALLLSVHRQAISTPLLVWVVSSSIALSWVVRSDPETGFSPVRPDVLRMRVVWMISSSLSGSKGCCTTRCELFFSSCVVVMRPSIP